MPPPPWDIYVDERKVKGDSALGFLAVPNTPSLEHKLYRCRNVTRKSGTTEFEGREIHWNNMHRGVVAVAREWLYRLFQHKGTRFSLYEWPKSETKELVILRFLRKFCKRFKHDPPFNVVVLLDHDTAHAPSKIQNQIRETGQIARCYHLDSSRNNCLQLCDLLLGVTVTLQDDPTASFDRLELQRKWNEGEKLTNSQVKRLLAAELAAHLDGYGKKVHNYQKR